MDIVQNALLGAANATLPYTRVAYLQSTGTQYIDTGVLPDFANGDEIEIHYYSPNFTGSAPGIFGSRDTGVVNGAYGLATALLVADANSYTTAANLLLGENIVKVNGSAVVVNGTSHAMPKQVSCARSMYLFALNDAGVTRVPYPGLAVMEWTYRRNGHVVQHLVPALDLNGVPCMWDTVSNTPKYNAGSGTFVTSVPVDGQTGVWYKEGATVISSGMAMSGAVVVSGQSQTVYLCGVASATVVSSGGTMTVRSGGFGSGATVYSGGVVDVYGNLTSAVATETGANINLFGGGTANDILLTLGTLLVSSGGFAENISIGGVSPSVRGILNIRAGGSVNSVTLVPGAREGVYNNGALTNLVMSAGVVYLRSPGIASGITLSSGTLVVSSGGTALAVTSNAGATVTVLPGGYIEYA